MQNPIKQPLTWKNYLVFVILFLASTYAITNAFYNLFAGVINSFFVIGEVIPLIVIALTVFTSFVLYYVILFTPNYKKQSLRYLVTSIVVGTLSLYVFIHAIILMGGVYHTFIEGMKTFIYPLDILILSLVGIFSAVLFLKKYLLLKRNPPEEASDEKVRPISWAAITGFTLYSLVVCYFTGMFLKALVLIDFESWSRHGLMIFLTYILFLIPLIAYIFYIVARTRKNPLLKKRLHLIFTCILAFLTVLVFLGITIYLNFYPQFYSWEMHYLFPVGFAIKRNFGIYILLAIGLLASAISISVYFYKYAHKPRKELKEEMVNHEETSK